MVGKFDGDAFSPGDVMREIRDLKRRMGGTETARRLESASFGEGGIRVHSGGSIKVVDGGQITAFHPDGSTGLTYGRILYPSGLKSIGLLVEDDLAHDRMNIFKAELHPDDGRRVFIGDTEHVFVFDVTAEFTIFRHATGGSVYFLDIPTTGSAANAHIDSIEGRLRRSTSSARYKQDVKDHAPDPGAVLALRPRSWRDKAEAAQYPDIDRRHVGFVAEEVVKTMPEAVDLDADAQPDSVSLPAVVAGLVSLCQAQQQRIEALETALGIQAPDTRPAPPPPAQWPRPTLPARPLPPFRTDTPRPDGIDTDD